jgi:hypothetical protein
MNPDSVIAWNVVLTIGVLVSIGANLASIARAGKAQKREVTITEGLVTQDICVQNRAAINDRITKLEVAAEASRKEASDSRARLYQHVDEFRRELSAKIDDMPAQIIVLLKNTGAIK